MSDKYRLVVHHGQPDVFRNGLLCLQVLDPVFDLIDHSNGICLWLFLYREFNAGYLVQTNTQTFIFMFIDNLGDIVDPDCIINTAGLIAVVLLG